MAIWHVCRLSWLTTLENIFSSKKSSLIKKLKRCGFIPSMKLASQPSNIGYNNNNSITELTLLILKKQFTGWFVVYYLQLSTARASTVWLILITATQHVCVWNVKNEVQGTQGTHPGRRHVWCASCIQYLHDRAALPKIVGKIFWPDNLFVVDDHK